MEVEMGTESAEPLTGRSWDFPGWGTSSRLEDLVPSPSDRPPSHKLGALSATAICGNDITSSCLYVSALCAAQAGKYAPIALGIVAAVLYLFRKIYAEVGSALPLNGGTYTVLLNTTNKRVAAGAACLTLLSYVATAVISASEAMHYAHNLIHVLPVFAATIGLLGLFAFLNVVGISESAVVAVGIFLLHMVTLTLLAGAGLIALAKDPSMLAANWGEPVPGGLQKALFYGFAAAMLGISGFESSANFIEEQEEGVFPQTLRNMWGAVAVFNPLLSLLSLSLLPLAAIQAVPPDLLARMGEASGGRWLATLVSVDAVLVLSGAVLTSYVGVTGLVRRMALDRCLPQRLLATNAWRGTNHWIIVGFFVVCVSILVATEGEVITLAGVYTLSFLSVMALFAVGNMLLKIRRSQLPRSVRAGWPAVIVALIAVLVGLVGNVLLDPEYVRVFSVYFFATGGVVALMFLRVQILQAVLLGLRNVLSRVQGWGARADNVVRASIQRIQEQPVVYFTRGDAPAQLNRAALYVLDNETTNRLLVVHVHGDGDEIPPGLSQHLSEIDHLYPELRVDFLAVRGRFGPDLIEALSKRLSVPRNYMFIGTPSEAFAHRIEELGGVRLIL